MPPTSLENARPSRTRRWRVPPPVRAGADRPVGTELLADVSGELGTVLWRTLRAVHLWASAPAAERRALFGPDAQQARLADILAAAPEPALEQPLTTLAGMLGKPDRVSGEQVALACTRIAAWGRANGAPGVCAEFTHIAAHVCPGDAGIALASARQSRDRGEYVAAEAGYERAVLLARQVPNWDVYIRAWAGLGKTAQAKGAYPTARRSLSRALRAAERQSLREHSAMVLHDLFTVEMECDNNEKAEQYAEASLHRYGVGHRNLRILACDIATFWMKNQGRFEEALEVLLRVLPHLDSEIRLLELGNIARAAGALGEEIVYDEAYREVTAAPASAPRKIDALQEAAQGAVNLGRLTEAERAARQALELASERRESKTVFMMEALIQKVERLRHAEIVMEHEALEVDEVELPREPLSPLSKALAGMLTVAAR